MAATTSSYHWCCRRQKTLSPLPRFVQARIATMRTTFCPCRKSFSAKAMALSFLFTSPSDMCRVQAEGHP
jgi:hypothetical protein